MKKLKNKVFWVIFSLLSVFTIILFSVATIKTYIERKDFVADTLTTIPEVWKTPDSRRIFLDSTIYTVILDNNGDYYGIINNTRNDEIDSENIKKIATSIIDNHKSNLYIGNLYANRYSYIFTRNMLIIMDNQEVNSMLINQLISYSFMLILCELLIFVAAYLLTKWIITPVKESFEKQKAFVADASHELKTPLSVIIASIDAYQNDENDKWIKNIRGESERMNKLVKDLLDLASTEEEKELVLEKHDLSNIVESSILTFESLFYENKLKLKYDVEKDISFYCDSNLIEDLMSILIDNAIKHSKAKGKVSVNLYTKNKQIVLEVINQGEPIKKGDEEKIFERFYKADASRNRNSNNYGLGLAIAKNIVTKHNGLIKAYSEDGYTTFKVIWNQK